ncbi:MAG: hypothetical protein H6555_11790 [Lewinellaceae bacterium]|nr:hypothetical protein [Lewinellaceae bacterium]
MKTLLLLVLGFGAFLIFQPAAQAALSPVRTTTVLAPENSSTKTAKELRRENRLQRLKAKWKARAGNLMDDGKFRLGALLLLIAIGLAILAALGLLSSLFSFAAGLFALGGVILVVWSLIENYG